MRRTTELTLTASLGVLLGIDLLQHQQLTKVNKLKESVKTEILEIPQRELHFKKGYCNNLPGRKD